MQTWLSCRISSNSLFASCLHCRLADLIRWRHPFFIQAPRLENQDSPSRGRWSLPAGAIDVRSFCIYCGCSFFDSSLPSTYTSYRPQHQDQHILDVVSFHQRQVTMSDLFNTSAGAGTAQDKQGQTIGTFIASLAGASAAFGVQVLLFYLLKNKFTRI